jgi:DNA-directed RNA polymerase subunit RPC12/RpoP
MASPRKATRPDKAKHAPGTAKLGGPTISFRCGECGTNFGKTQRELNLYGQDLNCPQCHSFVDADTARR